MIRLCRMHRFCGRRWERIRRCGLWRRSMEDIAGLFPGGRVRRGFGRKREWWSFAGRFAEKIKKDDSTEVIGRRTTEAKREERFLDCAARRAKLRRVRENRAAPLGMTGGRLRTDYSERMARICLPWIWSSTPKGGRMSLPWTMAPRTQKLPGRLAVLSGS